jgi:hypothetical protein
MLRRFAEWVQLYEEERIGAVIQLPAIVVLVTGRQQLYVEKWLALIF